MGVGITHLKEGDTYVGVSSATYEPDIGINCVGYLIIWKFCNDTVNLEVLVEHGICNYILYLRWGEVDSCSPHLLIHMI